MRRKGYMQVEDVSHGIFQYITYFTNLLKMNRRGKKDYVEKLELRNGKLIIHFRGYDEYLSGLELSMRHGERADGKDMVVITVREDRRPLLDILKADLDSEERRYIIKPEVEERRETEPTIVATVERPAKKRVRWRMAVEDRGRIIEIYNSIGERDKRAVWAELADRPFRFIDEDEVIRILRDRGHSKEYAYNLMLEIKEEWLEEGWIEVEEH